MSPPPDEAARPWRAGVRARVGAIVLAAMAAFAAALIWSSAAQLSSAYEEAARAEAVAIAKAIDATYDDATLDTPSVLLARIETLAATSPELREATIYRLSDGVPVRLVTTDRAVIGRALPLDDVSVFATGRPYYRRERGGGADLAAYSAPLGAPGAPVRAVLALRIDFAPRHAEVVARTRRLALAAGGVGALLVALVLLVLSRMLLRPLRRLTEATRRVAAGDLGARLGWTRADEVGEVGRAFDTMTEAIATTRGRLVEGGAELRRARAAQERLRRVAEAIAGDEDLAAVLARAAAEVGGLLGSDAAAVTRFDGGRLDVVASWAAVPSGRMRMDRAGATAAVRDTGHPARTTRVIPAPDGDRARVSAAAPVVVGGAVWGAVGVATLSVRGVPDDAAEVLRRFAGLVALAVTSHSARAQLREQATTDALTGLANHRAFQEALGREMERAARHGRPVALALIDLDHFKRVNDEHGHQAGDDVLTEAAARLRAGIRDGDTIARVGGEEFAWLMPETTGMEAWQAAERVREAIAATPFPRVGHVTISAGVCDVAHARDPGELYRFADGALYWSKHHGRDVVFLYSPEVVEVLSDAEQAARLGRRQALQSIRVLARAVEAKDPAILGHSERVADLAVAIATALGWRAERAAALREAGLVHDVGKIAIPEAILLKPGRLTQSETATVRTHAAIGAEMLRDVMTDEQVRWVRGHHERWGGGGYPDRLRGEEIPDGARILGLADAWDVMTSDRVYSAALTREEAIAEVRDWTRTQFWPEAVAALERLAAAGALPADAPAVEAGAS